MRARLNIAAIFIAVGLGALTVILVYDPGALIPRPPYFHWIFVLFSLAGLGMLFVLGREDDLLETDEANGSSDRLIHWRAVGLAFLTSVLASAAFIGATALVEYLDRAAA
ncbi:MAG TPA: hypothetical protein VLA73_04980 [Burkholderiales bacterium]|nr:hypothetical protein [Burkholderiales bacterium]